jgi:hypothetical protein
MSIKSKLWVIALLFLTAVPSLAQGVTYSWAGVESSDWNDPINWRPTGVPGPNDTAIVGINRNITTNTNVTVFKLNINAGSRISGNGSISLFGGGSFNDVRIGGPGNLIIGSGATVNITTAGTNNGPLTGVPNTTGVVNTRFDGNVYNYGIINWTAGNLLAYKKFQVLSSGTLNISSDAYLVQDPSFPTIAEIYGKLTKTSFKTTIFALPTNNRGRVEATSGTLDFRNGFTQYTGTTLLSRGTLTSPSALRYLGGRLQGSGTVRASVNNQGATVAPGNSPGSIVINGSYIQAANGTLQAEIGGTTPGSGYDQLTVNGSATLGGTLDLRQYAGFVPAPGNSFELMRYDSVSGEFATILNSFTNPGTYFTTSKTPDFLLAQANADAGLPTISITTPKLNQAGSSVPSASGTASDALSGIANVTVRLYRYAGNGITSGYWNGATWDATYNALTHERPATGTTAWSWNLPALAEGKYYVIAKAKDKANNTASTATIIFWIDTIIPATATITSPAHNTNVGNLNTVSGTATDAGSGIVRVDLRIRKSTNNIYTYWNGTAWVDAITNLTTTLAGSNWSRTHSATTPMPTGASLTNGTYMLTAYAYDRANLNRAAVSTVNVTVVPALQYEIESASSTHLVSAQWDAGKVQLTFSAPIDAASLPEAQFALSLNGAPLQVQSAVGNNSTVVISVPASSLPPNGATLTVSWKHLQDAGGAFLSGQTSLVANSK